MIFTFQTKGRYDFINITDAVASAAKKSGLNDGVACIFIPSSTCALTTMEYEGGVIKDFRDVLEKLAPEAADYRHHQRWGDRNGAAHIKSALLGTDLVVPVANGILQLGTWQQIVLIDFDEKPRTREIIVKIFKTQDV